MTFEINPGDVVIVRDCYDREFPTVVQRLTKTQIITDGWIRGAVNRYARETGVDLSSHYSRWSRRSCIVRLATATESEEHIARVRADRERAEKHEEMGGLFEGLPGRPYHNEKGWKVELKFEGMTEEQLRDLAAKLSVLRSDVETA